MKFTNYKSIIYLSDGIGRKITMHVHFVFVEHLPHLLSWFNETNLAQMGGELDFLAHPVDI